jgi:apolipoprotein N-acyltransferase
VVAPDGTIVARTGLFTADRLSIAVPLRTTWTPAAWLGDWPAGVLANAGLLLAVGGLASGIFAGRRRASRTAHPAATAHLAAPSHPVATTEVSR